LTAILDELGRYAPTESVQTLYIGGGSPTCLPPSVLCDFLAALTERLGHIEEFTVECNPQQADEELFAALRRCGVNRLSIGAQSFDAQELALLGRPHTPAAIENAVAAARSAGFDNIGLDLIVAAPGATPARLAQTLDKAIALSPTHLSAYCLTWEDGTPLTDTMEAGRIHAVDEDDERAMAEQVCGTLSAAGFAQYEISNFARPGFECRHNMRYWRNAPVIGLGPAASGWYRGRRTDNIADSDGYAACINGGRWAYANYQEPSPEQIACETAVLGLRLNAGLAFAQFQQQTGFALERLFAAAIAAHCKDGLLERTATGLRLTERGRMLADLVACDFVQPQAEH
jgi:oxygen-independent coproporphyrinogen-3 oxidase